MLRIYFATRLRGFFRHLVNSKYIQCQFLSNEQQIYETNNYKTKLKNRLGRSRIFDWIGFIHIVRCNIEKVDIIGSFNRFINTSKPYFIYVENPTALYHYRLERSKSLLGKIKIKRELNKPNLRGLIFMSYACASTFEEVCGNIPPVCKRNVIYPLIPTNLLVTTNFIENRCFEPTLKLLFIAQGMRFLSKGGLELLEAVKILNNKGIKIFTRIITSLVDLPIGIENKIRLVPNVKLDDFKFSFQEMQGIYASSHLLIQPTSDDSFNLTILEGMKAGLPIITSKLYAIPEMVEENFNGYLCEPHYWFFHPNNIPNPEVWNHRSDTIYSGYISQSIVEFLVNKISYLYFNRNELMRMSLNSLKKASNAPFSETYVASQWNLFLNNLI